MHGRVGTRSRVSPSGTALANFGLCQFTPSRRSIVLE